MLLTTKRYMFLIDVDSTIPFFSVGECLPTTAEFITFLHS